MNRRSFVGLAAGAALSGPMTLKLEPAMSTSSILAGGPAASRQHPGRPTLHVAGPREGELASWARRLQAPLALGLDTGIPLDLRYGGGVDGVTGANQFDARVSPDGQNALLLPGSVALDWLAGKGPVRFDPSHMLPLLAVYGPAVLMVRGRLPDIYAVPPGAPAHATALRPLRLATGGMQEAYLPAMLGLDLRGIPFLAVATGRGAASPALDNTIDAVFLHGGEASAKAPALLAAGFAPAFSARLDTAPAGAWPHAPSFLSGLSQARLQHDPLVAAWRATASASALCAALVLPRLSPASAIGKWRQAASACTLDDRVAAQAQRQNLLLVAGDQAGAALTPMQASNPVQLALHRWMAERLHSRQPA